jgi:hypothetical protein
MIRGGSAMSIADGRRSEVEGERLVAEFEAGDLGRKDFCSARSISVNTLDYWRKRLRQRKTEARRGRAGFVELPPMAVAAGFEVELELGGGVVLKLSRR